jgi:hypothetical protein
MDCMRQKSAQAVLDIYLYYAMLTDRQVIETRLRLNWGRGMILRGAGLNVPKSSNDFVGS